MDRDQREVCRMMDLYHRIFVAVVVCCMFFFLTLHD